MTIRFASQEHVPLADGTYMWLQVAKFTIENTGSDHDVISAVIHSPEYAYDYASPFETRGGITEPGLHGRWWRDRLSADLFMGCSPDDARDVIDAWATDQEWTDPEFKQPTAVLEALDDLYTLLRAGDVYQLRNPDLEHEHEYGWVTGAGGFHEFVVINRAEHQVTLIVATDD
jgi:hypothetical protein